MRARAVVSAAAVAAVGAGLVTIPAPAQATAITYRPTTRAISAPAPRAMRAANGHLFVSDHNTVLALSPTGTLEKTFTGMTGAYGMDVSPDGSTLYVALSGSGKVAVVDTTTLAVTSTWTTGPCTMRVALAGSTLFYGFGCNIGQIGAVSTSDGAVQDTAMTDTFSWPPMLAVAGATLVVGSPTLTRYDIAGSTLTKGTDSATSESLEVVTASPDGTSVATASDQVGRLVTRSPENLAQTATFETGLQPKSVAYSHNGELIAGGLRNYYEDELFVFNRTTGAKIVSADIRPPGYSGNAVVLRDTLTFSDDDSRVYVLARDDQDSREPTYLVTMTTAKPLTSSISITVKQPAHLGNHAVATVHTGLPNARVTFKAVANKQTVRYTATANASGVARWVWLPTFSGTVTATYGGDVTHGGSTRAAIFRVPSTTTVKLGSGYKHRSGVTYFKSANKVAAVATVHPAAPQRLVQASLLAYRSGRWVRVDRLDLRTDVHGQVGVYLAAAHTKTVYKITFTYKTSPLNLGSTASTPRFEIG